MVKSDWRALARWLSHEEKHADSLVPNGPVTVVVHPSDPRFPRNEIHAARYYLIPPHRVLLADASSLEVPADPHAVTLNVYCLSAQQVREGIRDLSDAGFSVPIWQRAATDFHHGVPELYGLIIRRR